MTQWKWLVNSYKLLY